LHECIQQAKNFIERLTTMFELFSKAISLFEEKEDFALACIVEQNGSTPRSSGAKMLITQNEIFGTIGGGGVEADVILIGREDVLADGKPKFCTFIMTSEEAAITDYICGGEIEVLIVKIDTSNDSLLAVFNEALSCITKNKKSWLVYAIDTRDNAASPMQLCLSVDGKRIIGTIKGDKNIDDDILLSPGRVGIHGDMKAGLRYVIDPIYQGGVIYLFGAGHVSKDAARFALSLDFRVVVIDDRKEFANPQRFPGCDIIVLDDFQHILELEIDDNSYILIITRGHTHDYTVLEWALKTDAYYIGMIGSLKKRDMLYDKLRKKGVAEETLADIHSPIGLEIGAQTPEEIGISIVAELIAERAKKE
jgi:xanthine dehydrogenase accessory factor